MLPILINSNSFSHNKKNQTSHVTANFNSLSFFIFFIFFIFCIQFRSPVYFIFLLEVCECLCFTCCKINSISLVDLRTSMFDCMVAIERSIMVKLISPQEFKFSWKQLAGYCFKVGTLFQNYFINIGPDCCVINAVHRCSLESLILLNLNLTFLWTFNLHYRKYCWMYL